MALSSGWRAVAGIELGIVEKDPGGFLHPVHRPRDVALDIDGLPVKSSATRIGSSYKGYA